MRKLFSATVLFFLAGFSVQAQVLENGILSTRTRSVLSLNLNEGDQQFRLGGFVQTFGSYTGLNDSQPEYRFGVRRAYLNLEGNFKKQNLSFLLQMDFADSYPLMDAWVAYKPFRFLKISAGQRQTFTNSREMMLLEQTLAFSERSLMSQVFGRSGRELGVFVESRIPMGTTGLDLGAAVTSGDGRNSFGSSSVDFDLGGLKYGGRATFYPFGFFTQGNELLGVDLARESKPRLGIGVAYSYNVGASHAVGEGHGDFEMFDAEGKPKYPDYQKISVDLLFRYQGFSFFAEYVNAIGANLNSGLFTHAALQPREIDAYLAIGNGVTLQSGYLTKSGWSFDVSHSIVKPEWAESEKSVVKDMFESKIGISKFFLGNNLKIQALGKYKKFTKMHAQYNQELRSELLIQIMF
ncbi:MAG: porin [Bacteroidales bacterium]